MKKIAAILVLALCFLACSKDNDVIPNSGQYVADLTDVYISLVLDNEKCTGVTVYTCGDLFGHWADITVTGSYPKYTYQVGDLTIRASFTDVDSFTASLSGMLATGDDLSGHRLALDYSGAVFCLDSGQ